MKTSLDHLPEAKRRELAHVVQVLREGFEFAIARRTMPVRWSRKFGQGAKLIPT